MRYEVAATMADQLCRETQSKVNLTSMQSIFPSITKFGMAALLPHKELTVELWNDILTVLADGQSTASSATFIFVPVVMKVTIRLMDIMQAYKDAAYHANEKYRNETVFCVTKRILINMKTPRLVYFMDDFIELIPLFEKNAYIAEDRTVKNRP